MTAKTAALAHDHDAVCIFVNDEGSAEALETLASLGVKYIALRVSLSPCHLQDYLSVSPPVRWCQQREPFIELSRPTFGRSI